MKLKKKLHHVAATLSKMKKKHSSLMAYFNYLYSIIYELHLSILLLKFHHPLNTGPCWYGEMYNIVHAIFKPFGVNMYIFIVVGHFILFGEVIFITAKNAVL